MCVCCIRGGVVTIVALGTNDGDSPPAEQALFAPIAQSKKTESLSKNVL